MLILHTAFLRPDAGGSLARGESESREAAARWLGACEAAGASALLLDEAIPAPWWAHLLPALRPPSGAFLPLAMRPPVPAPVWPPPESGDVGADALAACFPLADTLGCRLWILRLGAVGMEDPMEELAGLWRRERLPESEEGVERAGEILADRAGRAGPVREAARRLLERLFPEAERYGVTLCLESGRDVRAYPSYREAEDLIREFEGAPLGYWHNAGHAGVHAQLGLIEGPLVIERLSPHIRGGTLHDALGTRDHLPPGEGRVDFAALRAAVPDGLPWAVDVRRLRGKGAAPVGGAAERERWEEERARKGRGGLPPDDPPSREEEGEAEEKKAPAGPEAVGEALLAFAEYGF
ncbi:MAG: hypothetical protein V3V62_13720 [bacterium]